MNQVAQATTVVQLSDLHINKNADNPLISFNNVVELAAKEPNLKAVLLTGDLAQTPSNETYHHIAESCSRFSCPVYWIPGNHDDSNLMRQVFPEYNMRNDRRIVLGQWQIILLDSQLAGKEEGFLGHEQLMALEACLLENPELYTLVALHHHIVGIGHEYFDNIGLTNPEELLQLAHKYPSLCAFTSGHVHQASYTNHRGTGVFTCPSTNKQYKPQTTTVEEDNKAPGYRYFYLSPEGNLQSGIRRVSATPVARRSIQLKGG